MNRTIRAFFLAPVGAALTVNPIYAGIYWLRYRIEPADEGVLRFPDPAAPWEFVFLFSLYGIPAAMITLFVFWLPVRAGLAQLKLWNIAVEFVISILLSIPVMIFFQIGKDPFWVSFLAIHGIATGRLFAFIEQPANEMRGYPGDEGVGN